MSRKNRALNHAPVSHLIKEPDRTQLCQVWDGAVGMTHVVIACCEAGTEWDGASIATGNMLYGSEWTISTCIITCTLGCSQFRNHMIHIKYWQPFDMRIIVHDPLKWCGQITEISAHGITQNMWLSISWNRIMSSQNDSALTKTDSGVKVCR